jgi:hypothetical protein
MRFDNRPPPAPDQITTNVSILYVLGAFPDQRVPRAAGSALASSAQLVLHMILKFLQRQL